MVSSPTAVGATPNWASGRYSPAAGESPGAAWGAPSTFPFNVTVPGDAWLPSTIAPSASVIFRWLSTVVRGATCASLNVLFVTVTAHVEESPLAIDVGSHDCVSETPPCCATNATGRCWIGAVLNSGSSSTWPKYCVAASATAAVILIVTSAVMPDRTTTREGLTVIVVPSGAVADVA